MTKRLSCTAAERDLIEAVACLAPDEVPSPAHCEAYKRAHAAVLAERVPKTPEHAFETAVREACELWNEQDDPHGAITYVQRALGALDAARAEAKYQPPTPAVEQLAKYQPPPGGVEQLARDLRWQAEVSLELESPRTAVECDKLVAVCDAVLGEGAAMTLTQVKS